MHEQTRVYSVSEITSVIKTLLEESLPTVWIEGEISNIKFHSSGHIYFTLKDSGAQIPVVMWRSRTLSLAFQPEDGMKVQVLGNIRVYEKGGRYQLDALMIQPFGQGQLQMEFERLKQKLQAEGLFDAEHKKPLPSYPHTIGVVTSPTGAAIRYIVNVLKRRAPHVQIILRPTLVQGENAARDIVNAIREFNNYGKVDLLIVGRGGGSLEDLWPFNEEAVARAIYDSDLPIISAVGHEVDFTIADFVADLRAPTPSAAAELAVPDYVQLKQQILQWRQRIAQLLKTRIFHARNRVQDLARSYGLKRPEDLIHQYAVQVDELDAALSRFLKMKINKHNELIKQLHLRLNNLNPQKVLERGYSISYINGRIVRDVSRIKARDELETRLANGRVLSTVKQVQKEEQARDN